VTAIAVGVVQCESMDLDPPTNAERTEAFIRNAVSRGSSLTVLPELVATSYTPSAVDLAEIAESTNDPGPCLSAWSRAARDTKTVVVGGFAERDGSHLYNSAVVIGPDGCILDVYRKLHLFGSEHKAFSAGNLGLPIVEVMGIKLGVAVCYDLRFPEVLRILALRGCEVVAIPTAWVKGFDRRPPTDERIGQVDGATVQANLNQLYLVIADQVGSTRGVDFLGRSLVVDPYGVELVGPMSPHEEDIAVVQIDTAEVEAARHRGRGIDPLENRRTDVYASDLGYRDPRSDREA